MSIRNFIDGTLSSSNADSDEYGTIAKFTQLINAEIPIYIRRVGKQATITVGTINNNVINTGSSTTAYIQIPVGFKPRDIPLNAFQINNLSFSKAGVRYFNGTLLFSWSASNFIITFGNLSPNVGDTLSIPMTTINYICE